MPESGLLLHVCCAPCLATAMATLRSPAGPADAKPSGIIFYNPNIHPLLEFRRRVKALQVYLERDRIPAEIDDTYGLQEFLAHICPTGRAPDRRDRCFACYRMRLGRAAQRAAATGYAAISTTLLASREQDRDLVAQAGREAADASGVAFVQADLRAVLPPESALRGIYKQQYCGCIFSEDERFRGTGKHLYLPGGRRDMNDAPDE